MSASADFNNPLRKFKLVFLGEQSGKWCSFFVLRRPAAFMLNLSVKDSVIKGR